MRVGDYVRTKWGINKIIYIDDIFGSDGKHSFYTIRLDNDNLIFEDEVIKSSPNIIDLIEEHDLLKIEYYSLRYEKRVTRLFEVTYKDDKFVNLDNGKCTFMLTNNNFNKEDKELEPIIKSIVTREMFESMEYKVGE